MRKNPLILAAAASLAIAGMTVPASRWASAEDRPGASSSGQQQTQTQSGQTGQRQHEAGQAGANAAEQQQVRDALARIVEDATTPGKFNDLVKITRSDQIGYGAAGANAGAAATGAPQGINTGTSAAGTSTGTGTSAGTGASGRTGTPPSGIGSTGAAGGAGAASGTGATAAGSRAAIDTSDLDAKIKQFQQDWLSKYSQEFSFRSNAKEVFTESFARINTGDMLGEAARTAGERQSPSRETTSGGTSPRSDIGAGTSGAGTAGTNSSGISGNSSSANSGVGTNTPNTAGTTGTPGAAGTSGAGTPAYDNARAAGSRSGTAADRGDAASRSENAAVVLISGAANTTPVTLRMINEGGTWKVQTPQDPQKLKASLMQHLDMLERDKANWPSDPKEAYRSVAQHVLMAFNEDLGQRGGAGERGAGGAGAAGSGAGNPSTPNPNSGLGTGTGTSSGNNSTNGSKTNR